MITLGSGEKNDSPVIGKVCKKVAYSTSRYDKLKDYNLVKITNVHEDGSRSDSLIGIPDLVVDFYITKEKFRKFKDKKDYIDKRLCDSYKSTRARMAMNISRILYGVPDKKADLLTMKNSPYVYGCEQTTPVLIKNYYFRTQAKYQETESYTTAAYDVETNMINNNDDSIIMASTTFKEKIYFSAVRWIFNGMSDKKIIETLESEAERLLGDVLKRRNATVIWELFDNQAQVVESNVARWHDWHPDWIASWNAKFDMEKNEEALLAYNIDPAAVYSDPNVPEEFQNYWFNKGRTHKVKENGDKQPLEWQESFPTVQAMSSWQWLDAASFYAIKRAPQGKKDSYGLEFTAQDNGIEGKLYTESGSHLPAGSPDWHRYMQKNHIFEYCIYNIKDNITIEELNEKTDDLSLSLPMLLKSSEFFNYPSQPKCISDELSFVAKDNGYVWGTRGTTSKDELDDLKPDLKDWIALLETEKNEDMGKALFIGMPGIRSRGRGLTDDIDVTGAYPTATVALNVSNKTTRMEACKIEGLNRFQFREVGVNYASSPKANALSLCTTLHRFPTITEIEKVYNKLVA